MVQARVRTRMRWILGTFWTAGSLAFGCSTLKTGEKDGAPPLSTIEPPADGGSITTPGVESEPRTLSSSEVVARLGCGETKRVKHSGTPVYRGLSIEAAAKVALKIEVTATEGTPRVWLQSANSETRARSFPLPGAPAVVTYTPAVSESLVLALREANYVKNVEFVVTLSCDGASDPGDASVDGSVAEAGAAVDASSDASVLDGSVGVKGGVLLFGGYGGNNTYLSDTWEWNGTSWSQHITSTAPSARRDHALAYDSARKRVVLFGGDSANGRLSDTWEWDGNLWFQRSTTNAPRTRSRHAMSYDSARQRVILFSGDWTQVDYGNDTWEYDGASWAQRSISNGPATRNDHAMAYDSARQRIVLFGGTISFNSYFSDTWEWDGSSWSERATTNGPSERYNHAMAYDSARGRLVLFGGNGAYGIANDTWEWDGSSWTKRPTTNAPSPRWRHSMAYDSVRQRIVLFGGTTQFGIANDTWEWDGSTWTMRSTTSAPSARYDHAMVTY